MSTTTERPDTSGGETSGSTYTIESESVELRTLGIIGGVSFAVAFVLALPIPGANVVLIGLLSLVGFIGGQYVVSRRTEGARQALERTITVLIVCSFLLAMAPLVSVVMTTVVRGIARFDVLLFTSDMRNVVGEGGGVLHAAAGTLIITLLTSVISIPIGILTAIYLVEYGKGPLARAIRIMVDVMTGIPSIVAGLFAAGLFAALYGAGTKSGFAGACALAVLMVPVVVRSAEEMLRLVPDSLREAAYGLGVPKWRVIVKVVLPTAIAGLITGTILAVARVVGETAPLLIAAGITANLNLNPFDGRMASLPLFIYYSYATPGIPPQVSYDRGWAAALLLMLIIAVLFGSARLLGKVLRPKGLK